MKNCNCPYCGDTENLKFNFQEVFENKNKIEFYTCENCNNIVAFHWELKGFKTIRFIFS